MPGKVVPQSLGMSTQVPTPPHRALVAVGSGVVRIGLQLHSCVGAQSAFDAHMGGGVVAPSGRPASISNALQALGIDGSKQVELAKQQS